MTIKAAIFDYGGVLMRTIDPAPRRTLEQEYAIGDVDDLIFESPIWDEAQLGHITSGAFWDDMGRKLELGAEELESFQQRFWSGDRLDDHLVSFIRQLRRDGYRTALLSNWPASALGVLSEIGIADVFDVIVISGCEGVMKPNPAIYHLTLERLQVEPHQSVFIDDSSPNVQAARELGIHAVHFADPVATLAEVRQLIHTQSGGQKNAPGTI